MPLADPDTADYHLDGSLDDEPEEYARKAYSFMLHEIAKQHDPEDDGDVQADLYFRQTMVMGRVASLLNDERRFVDLAIALIARHDAYEAVCDG